MSEFLDWVGAELRFIRACKETGKSPTETSDLLMALVRAPQLAQMLLDGYDPREVIALLTGDGRGL